MKWLSCLTLDIILIFRLYDILKFPFSQKDFDNLIGLTKIFRAEGLNVTKRRKIYTLHSKNNLPSNILEEFSGTTLSYTGMYHYTNRAEYSVKILE